MTVASLTGAPSLTDDILLVIDPVWGLYLLQLMVRELEAMGPATSPVFAEDAVSLAMYIRDLLPPAMRIPVPAVAEVLAEQWPANVA